MKFNNILTTAIDKQASDILIAPSKPVFFRINGNLVSISDELIDVNQIDSFLNSITSQEKKDQLKKLKQIDFSFHFHNDVQLRCNAFYQKQGISLVIRIIPKKFRDFFSFNFPKNVTNNLLSLKQGLVLIVGPNGHGKSTTMSSFLNQIISQRKVNVITLEDPVEHVFETTDSLVQQRELGEDVLSYADGIKAAMRENPDILVLGEIRDYDTIAAALTLAETGHLVLSTLHTNSAVQTISRIIDACPAEKHEQIRTQLALCLKVIISQRLLPSVNDDSERQLCYEILTSNYAVQNYIRQNEIHQIPNTMINGKDNMVIFESVLAQLLKDNKISEETATISAQNPDLLKSFLANI